MGKRMDIRCPRSYAVAHATSAPCSSPLVLADERKVKHSFAPNLANSCHVGMLHCDGVAQPRSSAPRQSHPASAARDLLVGTALHGQEPASLAWPRSVFPGLRGRWRRADEDCRVARKLCRSGTGRAALRYACYTAR